MAVNLSPIWGAGAQLLDNSGNVLSGGKIYTYAAGTTTQVATYTSNTGVTANSNPIVLNSAGRVPYEIWLTDGQNYKFVLKDSNDVLIGTWDNLSGINSNFIAYTNQQEIQTATAGQTVFNLTTMNYLPGTNSLSVFVDGVNQYGPGAQYAYEETDENTVTFASGLHVGAEVKFTSSQIQNAGAVDASQVSYIPPFTNSVATNVEAKLAQYVSVKDFGAVGDGVTDDTVAFQNAVDSFSSSGGALFVPRGTYLISDTISVNKPISFIGENPLASRITSSTASTTLFEFDSYFAFENIGVSATDTTTVLHQLSTSTNHQNSQIRNVIASNNNYFLYSESPLEFTVDSCWLNSKTAMIWLNGTINPDQGDCYITNNTFIPQGGGSGYSILVNAGGGQYIDNNKFNGTPVSHIALHGPATGDFIISNNSIEGASFDAIDIDPGSNVVNKVVIVGNQFSGALYSCVRQDGGVRVVISSNVFDDVTSILPNTGIGINLVSGQYTTVEGNFFYNVKTAINTAAAAVGSTIQGNSFTNEESFKLINGIVPDTYNFRPTFCDISYCFRTTITSNSAWTTIATISGYTTSMELAIDGQFVGIAGGTNLFYKTINKTNVVTPIATASGLLFQFSGDSLQLKLDPLTAAAQFQGDVTIKVNGSIAVFEATPS